MSDDVFEAFGDDDIFSEDEEELRSAEGEGQNRTFIIAVAVLGGLLVCALISFGVWALVLNRPQEAQPQVGEMVASPTVEVIVEEAATPEPPAATDTPEPTPTPLLGPTATPTVDEEADPDTASAAEAPEEVTPTATQAPRRTPTPTRTPRPTPTTRVANPDTSLGASSGELSETGLGEWLLIGAAVILVAVMVAARKLRQA